MTQKIRCANPNCEGLFVPNPRLKNHRLLQQEGVPAVAETALGRAGR